MRFDVETGSQRRTIEVQRSGNRWRATVDGRVVWMDLTPVGDRWSLLIHGTASEGMPPAAASYEVGIESVGARNYLVHVAGQTVPVTFVAANSRAGRTRGTPNASGPAAIVAPMPGRVVKVLVKPGDTVAPRQALVVVEAMKMENELRSPRAGVVVEVRAHEGAPVEANTVLVIVS